MNKEEILKKIEFLDNKQGNYKDTTQVIAKKASKMFYINY